MLRKKKKSMKLQNTERELNDCDQSQEDCFFKISLLRRRHETANQLKER